MNKQATVSMRGGLKVKRNRPQGPSLLWRLSNFPNFWRGYWRMLLAYALGIPTMVGAVRLTHQRSDGKVIDYGVVSYRVVTDAFVNSLATWMNAGTGVDPQAFDYHASGIGTTAEAAADTALVNVTGAPARVAGTPTNPSANVYRTTATVSYTSSLAITEHGVFSASTSGTLLDRSVFSAVNTQNGDSITFQYSLTLTSGG